jgi:hypothetical protein
MTRLDELLEQLTPPDVTDDDLKALVMRFILDTPNDDPGSRFAPRTNAKLQALSLLHAILQAQKKVGIADDLVSLLTDANTDSYRMLTEEPDAIPVPREGVEQDAVEGRQEAGQGGDVQAQGRKRKGRRG